MSTQHLAWLPVIYWQVREILPRMRVEREECMTVHCPKCISTTNMYVCKYMCIIDKLNLQSFTSHLQSFSFLKLMIWNIDQNHRMQFFCLRGWNSNNLEVIYLAEKESDTKHQFNERNTLFFLQSHRFYMSWSHEQIHKLTRYKILPIQKLHISTILNWWAWKLKLMNSCLNS